MKLETSPKFKVGQAVLAPPIRPDEFWSKAQVYDRRKRGHTWEYKILFLKAGVESWHEEGNLANYREISVALQPK